MEYLMVVYLWIVAGILVNVAVKFVEDADGPFDKESLGIVLIWPLFLVKWLVMGYAWVLRNLVSSLGGAFKNLIGRK